LKTAAVLVFACAWAAPAFAQNTAADDFADSGNGAKRHVASGFVCPAKIGSFERDAVGEYDPIVGADFCAYSVLDGVYGTIKLTPLRDGYDAKASMAPDFEEQEGTGGRKIAEAIVKIGDGPLAVYTRTYQTARLEDLTYSVLFAGSAVKNWAVEATIEYADPRDTPQEKAFLDAVYKAALAQIGK
jgi:hypothetical protein